MPAALSSAVGVSAPKDHGDDTRAPWNHAQQADLKQVFLVDTELLNNRRHPKVNRVKANSTTEINDRQRPHAAILEGVGEAMPASQMLLVGVILFDASH